MKYITIATEKRLQDLMNREHQSNEVKFLTWALKEYKCIKGCGSASIKEIRKYAAQEDWLRNDFGFDTDGYMIETSSAMNIRFHDYMSYWCRFCYSSLDIKDFNGLVKAIYDMTDEYGYINYPEEESETETTEEVVESVEETTAPEAEQTVETAEQETELNTEVETEQTENNVESVSETYGGEDVKADKSKTDELSGATKILMAFGQVVIVSEYFSQRGYIDTS